MLEYASPWPEPRGRPLPRLSAVWRLPYPPVVDVRFSTATHMACLVRGVASRETIMQEWSLEEVESMPYRPTLPSVYVSQSGVLGQVLR